MKLYDIEYFTKANGSLMCHDQFEAETREDAERMAADLLDGYGKAEYGIVDADGEETFTVSKTQEKATVYIKRNPEMDLGREWATFDPEGWETVEESERLLPEGFSVSESEDGRMFAYDEFGAAWKPAIAKDGKVFLDLAQHPSREDISVSYMSRMQELGCAGPLDGRPIFWLKKA